MSLRVPTGRPNVASSNGRCIWPRPNEPRSPPERADEQSLVSVYARELLCERCKVVEGWVLAKRVLVLSEYGDRLLFGARDIGLVSMENVPRASCWDGGYHGA